ncbi:hypothetical protein D3C87_1614580 [compost metagenome]
MGESRARASSRLNLRLPSPVSKSDSLGDLSLEATPTIFARLQSVPVPLKRVESGPVSG